MYAADLSLNASSQTHSPIPPFVWIAQSEQEDAPFHNEAPAPAQEADVSTEHEETEKGDFWHDWFGIF